MPHPYRALLTRIAFFLAVAGLSFAQAQAPLWATLYTFSPAEGGCPNGPPVIGPGGVLYGGTCASGASGMGNVYSLTPPSSSAAPGPRLLYTFAGGSDGSVSRWSGCR